MAAALLRELRLTPKIFPRGHLFLAVHIPPFRQVGFLS
jgi:hypothetical protein